jgi:predicted RNase H-like HicB family nuclease
MLRVRCGGRDSGGGDSGYAPDLPGCVAARSSVTAVKAELAALIPFHLEGLRDGGQPVAQAESVVEWVEV